MTPDELRQIMPHAGSRADIYAHPLRRAMDEFGIDTPLRQAAFLAQVAHESGSLRYVRELASGEAYEGRSDLGNTEPGDGVRYKGRGLIQITGRANYELCGIELGADFISQPHLLEEPEWAAKSAAWFWSKKRLNELADRQDFKLITKRINGGYNGYQDRLKHYERAKKVLGFIALPLWGYILAGMGVVLVLSWGGLWVQTQRLEASQARIAAIQAEAEAQKRAMELKTAQDGKLKKEKDDEAKRRYADLSTRYQRLLQSGPNVLPPAPASGDPDAACFDRGALERALGGFITEVAGITLEGDKAVVGLSIARQWTQELLRR